MGEHWVMNLRLTRRRCQIELVAPRAADGYVGIPIALLPVG